METFSQVSVHWAWVAQSGFFRVRDGCWNSGLATEVGLLVIWGAMKDTVLVVEDETDVVNLVRYNLKKAGFEVRVATNGYDGLREVEDNRPDAVVLDIMLPGMDGFEVCKKLRRSDDFAGVGILMLTAKGEPDDRIKGLELGADDYLTKPFSPKELILRLKAILKRLKRQEQAAAVVSAGEIDLDKKELTVRLEGKRLDLTMTEFKLLSLLIEARGRIKSRVSLLHEVWGYSNVDTRTVDTHISRLREKLGPSAKLLKTVRGEGYRFLVQE